MPDVGCYFIQLDALFFSFAVDEAELHIVGEFRKDGEVCTGAIERGA